jgi:hypothetical protein
MNRVSVLLWVLGAGGPPLFVSSREASAHEPDHVRPVQELFMPESWAGQWRLRFEHRDRETGGLISTEEMTDVICPRDRVGLSAYVGRRRSHGHHDESDADGLRAACAGVAEDGLLGVACSSRLIHNQCRLEFEMSVRAERRGDAIGGSSEWAVTAQAGDCGALLENASLGETVQVSGTRLGQDPGACSAPPSSLIEKLPVQPELVLFLPRPIADLAARGDARSVLLSWTPVPRAAEYKLYRARPGERFHFHGRRPARAARFQDQRARAGQLYRYVVRWVDAEGRESPVSNEASAAAGTEEVTP